MNEAHFEELQQKALDVLKDTLGNEVGYILLMTYPDPENSILYQATGGNMTQETSLDTIEQHMAIMRDVRIRAPSETIN